jgi:hypothetical protein
VQVEESGAGANLTGNGLRARLQVADFGHHSPDLAACLDGRGEPSHALLAVRTFPFEGGLMVEPDCVAPDLPALRLHLSTGPLRG